MTEKQENILNTALTLFAEKGYDATSTSRVAKEAGVSEGLIFRHFTNKEGLLSSIMEMGGQRIEKIYAPVLSISDPKEKLKCILEMPFGIKEDQFHFWKLLYALKWQAEVYDSSMSEPVKLALIEIFEKLNYDDPKSEADLVLSFIDGMATAVLLKKPKNLQGIKRAVFNKYGL